MAFLTAILLASATAAPATIRCPVVQSVAPAAAIKGVTQPAAHFGGADAETVEDGEARIAAPVRNLRSTEGKKRAAEAARPQVEGSPNAADPDFPEFVGDVIKDDFVEAGKTSREQMDSYSDLVANASSSADRFTDENTSSSSTKLRPRDPRCDPKRLR